MTKNLTKAQRTRRTALLERIGFGGMQTAPQLVLYLADRKKIYVTKGTVSRDLREMEEVGTLRRGKHPTEGHMFGGNNWVAYQGWEIASTSVKRRLEAELKEKMESEGQLKGD